VARVTNIKTDLTSALTGIAQEAPRKRLRVRRVPVYCGICGGEIDKKLKAPHPGSWSLDHKLPKSLGGSDHVSNLQAAHLGCNRTKGNRPALYELLGS
jgi:5-methylcytosine-specific restriction endonuclease McrA